MRVSRETQHELTLDHVAIPIAIWDKMKGAVSKNGVSFQNQHLKEMPYFAVGAIGPLSNGEKSAAFGIQKFNLPLRKNMNLKQQPKIWILKIFLVR